MAADWITLIRIKWKRGLCSLNFACQNKGIFISFIYWYVGVVHHWALQHTNREVFLYPTSKTITVGNLHTSFNQPGSPRGFDREDFEESCLLRDDTSKKGTRSSDQTKAGDGANTESGESRQSRDEGLAETAVTPTGKWAAITITIAFQPSHFVRPSVIVWSGPRDARQVAEQ